MHIFFTDAGKDNIVAHLFHITYTFFTDAGKDRRYYGRWSSGVMHTCFTSRTCSSRMQKKTEVGGVLVYLFHLTYMFFTDAAKDRDQGR